jgi:GTP cyclohydrolase I
MENKLPDIQNSKPNIRIPIKQVGVENINIPFLIKSKYNNNIFETVTDTSVRCSIDSDKKGISMSRCIRTLKNFINKQLNQELIKQILFELRDNLESNNVFIKHKFKFPIFRKSVLSDNIFPVYYDSFFEGKLINNNFYFYQGIKIQYASYCPCSTELSYQLRNNGLDGFPHNQRSFANIIIRSNQNTKKLFLEDINELVENVIKTLPYSIIKRVDEQEIARIASENPLFVEDAIRLISNELDNREEILDWFVKCVHEESIHTSEAISINYKGIPNGLNDSIDLVL